MHMLTKYALKYGPFFPYIFIFGYFLFKSLHFPFHDFGNSYFGAYLFLKGKFDLGIFDPYTFNKRIFEEGFSSIFASYNPNPPSVSLLFIPFALLNPFWAKLTFNVLSSALFLISLYQFCAHRSFDKRYLAALPFLFFVPIGNNLLFGQSYLLLVSLLLFGFMAYEKEKRFLFSILWALAIFIKVFPIVLFVFVLFKRDWKSFLSLFMACLFLLGCCVLLQGGKVWHFYFFHVLPQNSQGNISSSYVVSYQSFYMFFKYLFVKEPLLNPSPFVDSVYTFQFLLAIIKGILAAFACTVIFKKKSLFAFGFLFLCSLLFMPYGSSYGSILLLPLYVACLSELKPVRLFIISVLVFLISNLNVGYFHLLPPPLQFPRLFLLTVFFVYVCFSMAIFPPWKWIAFCSFIFMMTIDWTSPNLKSKESLLVNSEHHLLLFDYGVEKGTLYYDYWNDKGPNRQYTSLKIASVSDEGIKLQDNQVFFHHRQLTFSSGTKLKPKRFGNRLVYLSDQGHGQGFYALWSVPIQ